LGSYLGSDGQPIDLAQTGHATLELTRIKKYNRPVDITDLQLQNCDAKATEKK
jgi:hypothetical protein